MKALILVVAAAALGATALTVVVGTRLAEPTVVENPYEQGLRYDADRRARAAAAMKPERAAPARPERSAAEQRGVEGRAPIDLTISPQPPRAMTELDLVVRAPAASRSVTVAFSMPGMHMGENRVALRDAGDGTWRGKGVVVRCPSGGRTWNADVRVVPASGPGIERRFTFEVAPP